MKKMYIIAFAILALASCENYFDAYVLQNNQAISDVCTKNYILTKDDYKIIAQNAHNIDLAIEADSIAGDTINKPAQNALAAIAKNGYFTEEASADTYLPAFIANKYPQLNVGSQVNITYNQYGSKTSARNYKMLNEDYKSIWDGNPNYYISPSAEDKFIEWMDGRFTSYANKTFMFVTYNYQNIEPLPFITTIADILYAKDAIEHQVTGTVGKIEEPIQGYFWLVDGQDSIYVCGLKDSEGHKRNVIANKGIKQGDLLTIRGTYNASYTAHPALGLSVLVEHKPANIDRRMPMEVIKEERTKLFQYDLATKHWIEQDSSIFLPASVYEQLGTNKIENPTTVIDIYLRGKYPFAVKNDAYLAAYYDGVQYVLEKYTFDGTAFVPETGISTETMAFEIKNDTWKADVSTFYKQTIVGEGQGGLSIVNVDLGSLNYIWSYSAVYGMKATTYSGGAHPGEAWLVTPPIKLKKAIAPALKFDQAINYGPTDSNRGEELSVWVATTFDGATINEADWTQLPWNAFNNETNIGFPDANSWTFFNSGDMDLSAWAGQTIYIAWRYKALDGWTCATWELKNILVHETAPKE